MSSQTGSGTEYTVWIKETHERVQERNVTDVTGVSCTCPWWPKQKRWLDQLNAGIYPPREPDVVVTLAGELPVCKHVKAALFHRGWRLDQCRVYG